MPFTTALLQFGLNSHDLASSTGVFSQVAPPSKERISRNAKEFELSKLLPSAWVKRRFQE
jgi:hypothetical protein